MAEREPLDLQPLTDKYPTLPSEKDLLLGESHRIDLGNGIHADIFTKHRVIRVETPIEAFTLTGLRSVTVGSDSVAFESVRNAHTASLTFFPDGSLLNEVKPIAPLPALETLPAPVAHKVPDGASEKEAISFKGNIGRDPRTVTTDKGQMYFYPFGIHEDKATSQGKQKATWVKVGIPLGQEALIINPALVSETNPLGLTVREGDFVQQLLLPGKWQEIAVGNKQNSEVRVKEVSGYFLTESTMLKQRHR